MNCENREKAIAYLQTLIGQTLHYALKSPDMDLYDLGFGAPEADFRYVLHATCRFKVIWRNGERRTDKYYEDTPSEEFHSAIQRLIGWKVTRVGLSDKNDLWLDFGDGDCWAVFVTFENNEESWRFFTYHSDDPHLVASDSWLDFH